MTTSVATGGSARADTVRQRPSVDVREATFPGVHFADGVSGKDSRMDIVRARGVLGCASGFAWRELL
jgi:hypothetical protein